ncbi:putative RNA-directed DNA polymerase, partial [Tanacetum coccineum]
LVERVRCLLSHVGLPASFWGEALNTVTFMHIPKDKISKLDVKGKPCVFLGYGQNEFGYMLYDPVQKKLVRSRDVVFEEDLTLKDVEKAERETIPQHNDDLIDLDPVPPKHFDSQFGDDIQNDEEQGADDVDAQEQPNLDEDVHPELPVPNMPPFLPLRRSTRDHHPSTRYSSHEYVLLTDGGEPECYAEAMEDEHKKEWFKAMEDEMNSLHENNTFELVKLPKGKRALKNKWVYKLKTEENTSRPRYKARLVVLGLAASLDLEVEQMDVKTAFLHGDLDKEIYIEQPEGFQVKGKEGYACRLQKNHRVFFQKFGDDDFIILLLYVDDMLIVGKNIRRIAQLKRDLSKSFSMKDLGPAKQIIGIRIFRDRGAKKLHMSQEQYIEKVLCRFNMDKAKVVSSPLTTNFKLTDKDCPSSKKNIEKMDRVPYASAVGSLMYAMVCTRPDLAHAVGVVSRFLSNPGKKHWEAVKWIFRYLRGTSKLGITFGNGKPMLVGFTDSDMAGNKDNMKSTSGYLMTFAGGAVSWQSRLQKCVALSTTEAEYMAATEACKELLWLKRFLQELGFKQQRYAVLCDNQSAIHLAKNSMFHKRTKHIDIRYHWIRDAIEDGMFELNKVHTDDNASDMLTKAVAREKLKLCLSNVEDRWSWSLSGHGEFSVKSAREVIYKHVLITSSTPTRWSKVLPIKLNVFMWCMLLNKLPTRSNLAIRGLDVPCSLCLNCRMGVETRDHLFFVCPMALDLFRLLGRWWNIKIPILLDSSTCNSLRLNSLQKLVLEASFSSLWWHIWIDNTGTVHMSTVEPIVPVMDKVLPSSYATKICPTSSSNVNLRKLEANVLVDVDYHGYLWLQFMRDGPWMIHGVLIFLNKRSPSVSLLKEELSREEEVASCPVGCLYIRWVKLNRLENRDNLVMVVPNLEGPGYTKETMGVEYEWQPPRCSTCFLFGHSVDNCPKALKRVLNMVEKGKGGSSRDDDEGFIEVNQTTEEVSPKTTSSVGKKNVSTSGNSSKKKNTTNATTSYNGVFLLSNSFEALNVDDSVTVEVESGNKASTSCVQEGENSSTPLVEKIHRFEKQLLEGTCVLMDEDGKPLKNDDYSGDYGSEDEVEPSDNEMTSFLASKQSRVGYGTKSLLEQWRDTYGDVEQEYNYDMYDDDMYEGKKFSHNIQTICINLDIKDREIRLSVEDSLSAKHQRAMKESLVVKHQRAVKDSLSAKPQRATSDVVYADGSKESQGWQYPDPIISETVPPIKPPLGANNGNPTSPNKTNRIPVDITNNTTTTNVVQNVVNEDLPQLLDSRGGSHVTNVPAFDVEDFSSWKDRFLVYLDGLEPYLIEILENGPFVPKSLLSTSTNIFLKPQKQWSHEDKRLANQDKKLKSIIISCLPNDVMMSVIKCTTAKAIWTDLILAHKGPSDTRDTKIAALRLKLNAFKALKDEKVNGTFTRLKCLLNDLENKGVSIPQAEVNTTFVNSLPKNGRFHDKALLANQKMFYKRSGRVGSAKKPMDKSKEISFACGKLVSFEDEEVTRVKAFMSIAEDEPSVGKADARSGQWVAITMKKVQRILSMTDGEERKHILDYTHVDLHYVENQRKNLLSKFNSLNQELSSCKSELCDLKNTKALNYSLQNEIAKLNLEKESMNDEISELKKVIEK